MAPFCRGDHDQIARRHDVYELAAVAPREVRGGRRVGNPPQHAVGDAALGAVVVAPGELRLRGGVDPSRGYDAALPREAMLKVELPELEQVPPAKGDARSSVDGAAIERLPGDARRSKRAEETLVGELGKRNARRPLQDDAEDVHRRGVVGEGRAWYRRLRAVEQVLDSVLREDPRVVVAIVVPLEAGRHRQKMTDRDPRIGRLHMIRGLEVPGDRDIDSGENVLADGDARECRDHALGHRADVERRLVPSVTEVTLVYEATMSSDEQAPETRNPRSPGRSNLEQSGIHAHLGGGRRLPRL